MTIKKKSYFPILILVTETPHTRITIERIQLIQSPDKLPQYQSFVVLGTGATRQALLTTKILWGYFNKYFNVMDKE